MNASLGSHTSAVAVGVAANAADDNKDDDNDDDSESAYDGYDIIDASIVNDTLVTDR